MRPYLNKPIEGLARELTAGLARLKKGYIDAAEELARILEPSREYPYDFVVYRLTGYRPPVVGPGEVLKGSSLHSDLLRLILDICDSARLRTSEYSEKVYRLRDLTERFGVSQKTISRWMRGGLVARRLVFPTGQKLLAFLESSVEDFVGKRGRALQRASRFTQMTASERADIIRRARRMASFSRRPLSQIARRLAARTGRAVETIRYTIRRHDAEHPDQAVFPHRPARLGDAQKQEIYESFFHGVPVPELRQRYRKSRDEIYHIVYEAWADRLIREPIYYVPSPEFEQPGAEERILGPGADAPEAAPPPRPPAEAMEDLPSYLRSLYDVPLLDARRERELFRRYNYLKFRAETLRRRIDRRKIRVSLLKEVEALRLQANVVKNQIIRANLRLVVSIAKKHLRGPMGLFELISDGNVSLMRAVEKFDYTRGHRFSTYASWAIMRNFARSVPRERSLLDRFSTGHEELLDSAGLRGDGRAITRPQEADAANLAELRESIDVVLKSLSATERSILVQHYGLDSEGQTRTLDQLGRSLGMSKERVRQIELKALRKLRGILRPVGADLMS